MVEQPVRQAVMGSAEGWRWLSTASTGDEACLLLLGGPGLLHGRGWLGGKSALSRRSGRPRNTGCGGRRRLWAVVLRLDYAMLDEAVGDEWGVKRRFG